MPQKTERRERNIKIYELYQTGMLSYKEIGKLQKPAITKERVRQLIVNEAKRRNDGLGKGG